MMSRLGILLLFILAASQSPLNAEQVRHKDKQDQEHKDDKNKKGRFDGGKGRFDDQNDTDQRTKDGEQRSEDQQAKEKKKQRLKELKQKSLEKTKQAQKVRKEKQRNCVRICPVCGRYSVDCWYDQRDLAEGRVPPCGKCGKAHS